MKCTILIIIIVFIGLTGYFVYNLMNYEKYIKIKNLGINNQGLILKDEVEYKKTENKYDNPSFYRTRRRNK